MAKKLIAKRKWEEHFSLIGDFDTVLEAVLAKTTHAKAAEVAGCSERMITFWKRTRFSEGLTETENKIIDAMAEFLGFKIRNDETRKAFARRVLETAVRKIPKYQIASLSHTSLGSVQILFEKRNLKATAKKDWTLYENFRGMVESLVASARAKKIDRHAVRLLLHATKSARRTASILGKDNITISWIRGEETKKDPNWLLYLCPGCKNTFAPSILTQRFCSRRCRKDPLKPEIPRENIRTLLSQFQSAQKVATILGCCLKTVSAAFKIEQRKNPNWLLYACPVCKTIFPPKVLYQKFCCDACTQADYRKRKKEEIKMTFECIEPWGQYWRNYLCNHPAGRLNDFENWLFTNHYPRLKLETCSAYRRKVEKCLNGKACNKFCIKDFATSKEKM